MRKLTNTPNSLLSLVSLIVACLQVPVLARTSCVVVSVDVPKSLRESDLVFVGRLLKNEADIRLTFQGENTWKGLSKGREVVVYELGLPDANSYHFRERERFLIFALVLSAEERELHGVVPEKAVAYGFRRGCGGAPWPLVLSRELDKLAKPRKPPKFPFTFAGSVDGLPRARPTRGLGQA